MQSCLQKEQQQASDCRQSMTQANPNKITNYYVDLAPGSSLDLGNQNGYPRIAATAPGRSVVVAQVRVANRLYKQDHSPCIPDTDRCVKSILSGRR